MAIRIARDPLSQRMGMNLTRPEPRCKGLHTTAKTATIHGMTEETLPTIPDIEPEESDETAQADDALAYDPEAAPGFAHPDDAAVPSPAGTEVEFGVEDPDSAALSFASDFDIEAALAAVGSLEDVIAEREAQEAAERARLDSLRLAEEERQEAKRREDEEYARWIASYHFARPPLMRLQRGQPASVIPALLLIASGAYLTFSLTLSELPPAPELMAVLLGGLTGLILLAHWLNSGRWARGALFAGLAILLSGGAWGYLTLPGGLEPADGWGVLIAAGGVAMILTALLALPPMGRLIPLGLASIAGGAFMIAAQTGLLDSTLLTVIRQQAVVVLVAALVFMVLPLLFRRRG